MAACFVSAHSIMDTPHFSGDTVHGAQNRNVIFLSFFFSPLVTDSLRGGGGVGRELDRVFTPRKKEQEVYGR